MISVDVRADYLAAALHFAARAVRFPNYSERTRFFAVARRATCSALTPRQARRQARRERARAISCRARIAASVSIRAISAKCSITTHRRISNRAGRGSAPRPKPRRRPSRFERGAPDARRDPHDDPPANRRPEPCRGAPVTLGDIRRGCRRPLITAPLVGMKKTPPRLAPGGALGYTEMAKLCGSLAAHI